MLSSCACILFPFTVFGSTDLVQRFFEKDVLEIEERIRERYDQTRIGSTIKSYFNQMHSAKTKINGIHTQQYRDIWLTLFIFISHPFGIFINFYSQFEQDSMLRCNDERTAWRTTTSFNARLILYDG